MINEIHKILKNKTFYHGYCCCAHKDLGQEQKHYTTESFINIFLFRVSLLSINAPMSIYSIHLHTHSILRVVFQAQAQVVEIQGWNSSPCLQRGVHAHIGQQRCGPWLLWLPQRECRGGCKNQGWQRCLWEQRHSKCLERAQMRLAGREDTWTLLNFTGQVRDLSGQK